MNDDKPRVPEIEAPETHPATRSWKEALALLRAMPKPSEVELIERTEMPDREWD
jgi:hypothetical protein